MSTTAKDITDTIKSGKNSDPIQYPSDIQKGSGKYIVHFSIVSSTEARNVGTGSQKIEDPENGDGSKTLKTGSPSNEKLSTSQAAERKRKDIYLYMPENITEAFSHDWETFELGTVKRMTDLVGQTLSGQGGSAISQLTQQAKLFMSSLPEAATALNTRSLLERNTGIIVNPNIELLYKGTQLKTHNFQFKFIPKNKKESLAAKKIVEMFKYYSAANAPAGNSSTILYYPEVFKIKFMYIGATSNQDLGKNGWLHHIQPCALTSCEVNYTGAGQFAALKDGAPAHIDLTLSFQELTIMTKGKIRDANTIEEVRQVLI